MFVFYELVVTLGQCCLFRRLDVIRCLTPQLELSPHDLVVYDDSVYKNRGVVEHRNRYLEEVVAALFRQISGSHEVLVDVIPTMLVLAILLEYDVPRVFHPVHNLVKFFGSHAAHVVFYQLSLGLLYGVILGHHNTVFVFIIYFDLFSLQLVIHHLCEQELVDLVGLPHCDRPQVSRRLQPQVNRLQLVFVDRTHSFLLILFFDFAHFFLFCRKMLR